MTRYNRRQVSSIRLNLKLGTQMLRIGHALTLAIGISMAATSHAQAQEAQAQETQPRASGVVQGMSQDRLDRISGVMLREIEKGTFPGAVTLIARRGEIVHLQAHGSQDSAKTKPMKIDSIFRFASLTKAIVTTAAMMLVEQGVIKISDPVADYLPELKDLKVESVTTAT